VLVNSPDGDVEAVGLLFDRIAGRVQRAEVFVVAAPAWAPWLETRGLARDAVLLAADANGQALELNYFLESPNAGMWIRTRRFDFVTGSVPHSLYNEEIKTIFEERLAAFVGGGRRFIAHTLPAEDLYVFDLPALLLRGGRPIRVDEYLATCREMMGRWHEQWIAAGQPPRADGTDLSPHVAVLADHLGDAILSFDETSSIPLERLDPLESATGAVRYLQDALAKAQGLQSEVDRLQGEVNRRDVLLTQERARYSRTIGGRSRAFVHALARRVGLRRP
jgi:hypothetical protein